MSVEIGFIQAVTRTSSPLVTPPSSPPARLVGLDNPGSVPDGLRRELQRVPVVAVGPRASEARFATRVAIDTGVAGIHEAGTGYRMDDVPLPLTPVLAHPRTAGETLELLRQAIGRRAAGGKP